MEERHLGKSGLRVSLVGLGTNVLGLGGNMFGRTIDEKATDELIGRAYDLGVTTIDTSNSYNRGGSEEAIGKVMGARRQHMVIATKFASPMSDTAPSVDASRRNMIEAVDASLKRLRTDWIDLYQVHRCDPRTPVEETVRGLDDLVRAGKIRYAGISNYPAWRITEAQWTARSIHAAPLVSYQDAYNLFDRRLEDEILPAMEAAGMGLLPYYPLAGGLLTGKYQKGGGGPKDSRLVLSARSAKNQTSEARWVALDKLDALAKKGGRTMLDLAFGWLASRKAVSSIIAGATSAAQLEANVKAAEARLNLAELAEIDEITAGFRKPA